MKIVAFQTEEEWLESRRGRITGTRLKDLVTKGKPKKGFYEIIAERVAIPQSEENVMLRGKRLESEAVERFAKETGKKVITDLVLWMRDDDENIALSPDGYIAKKKKITEGVEVKCLNSAAHIEAFVTSQVPDEYQYQVLQYFITCDTLEVLHFVFYDPRMPRDFFWIDVHRDQDRVDEYLTLEREALVKMAEIEKALTF